ncbi:MAG: transketolase family protein [Thermoplasmata archaeon]|nr:transketolase family protein [Thermoplasmatales archaeon]PMP75563.1 MAG: transketolase [Aciduliprofundum sp.]HEU12811.1 transketolase family protein [Euryarchaeota archaeon]
MNESQRQAYGETLVKLGSDRRIVVLDADLSSSTHTIMFQRAYPDRFFNMGIQEQNMVGVAAGLAMSGKIPFASSFAVFVVGRAYDVIRQSIAYTNANVKIVATHGGITVGEDGATHQMLEDLGIMCGLPNFRVIAPADAQETRRVIENIAYVDGPFYVRLSREKVPTILVDEVFDIGKGIVIREGDDITLISTGIVLSRVIEAAETLAKNGISASVIHMPTLKPIDKDIIVKYAIRTGRIITVEEHTVFNGLGSRVAEVLSENHPTRLSRIGINDVFGESGPGWELLEKYGISAKNISEKAISMVRS